MIRPIAQAAREVFGPEKELVMLAIAGSESAFNEFAEGDKLESFAPIRQQEYRQFAFGGYLSFGPWQIFLGVHTPLVRMLSGLSSPAELAVWLFNPLNSARVAKEILVSQGLEAWSTYGNKAYLDFEIEASAALAGLDAEKPSQPGSAIVAVSFSANVVHLDTADGGFIERKVDRANIYGDWLRFDLLP